ncbi:MAG: VOC family protein [Acidobacteria bacterium]|nr:VOC family protein [Acidobacteriota bacterium]
MARVCTYLNFPGNTEEAFTHYRDLFGTQFVGPIFRFGDMEMGVEWSEDDARRIMHMEVEIVDGHVLMATDMLESQGMTCRVGNNTTIMVEVESREEVDRLYAGLAAGLEENAPADQPWGSYWSTCLDRFGIRWMIATPMATPAS